MGVWVVVGDIPSITAATKALGQASVPCEGLIIGGTVAQDSVPHPAPYPIFSFTAANGAETIAENSVVKVGPLTVFGLSNTKESAADILWPENPVDVLISGWPMILGTEGNLIATQAGKQLKPFYHVCTSPETQPAYQSEPFHSDTRNTTLIRLGAFTDRATKGSYFSVPVNERGVLVRNAQSGVNFYDPALSHAHDVVWGTAQPSLKRPRRESGEGQEANAKNGQLASRQDRPPRPCFLCLDSESSDKDLIIREGPLVYLSTAKGPVSIDAVISKLNCRGHVLIVPNKHIPSLSAARSGALADANKYRLALVKVYAAYGLGHMMFEYVRARTIHGHMQLLALPSEKEPTVRDELIRLLRAHRMSFGQQAPKDPRAEYLMVRFGSQPPLYATIRQKNVDLQIPRQAVVIALGLGDQLDWRRQVLDNEKEDAQALAELLDKHPL